MNVWYGMTWNCFVRENRRVAEGACRRNVVMAQHVMFWGYGTVWDDIVLCGMTYDTELNRTVMAPCEAWYCITFRGVERFGSGTVSCGMARCGRPASGCGVLGIRYSSAGTPGNI
ncbi:unnamed protein product [Ectocarpus sp. 4 AP-2014]